MAATSSDERASGPGTSRREAHPVLLGTTMGKYVAYSV